MNIARKEARCRLIDASALADASECLKSIAHPTRLRIIELLLQGEYTVGELAEECETLQNVVSEHLGVMRDRGLLERERRGRCTYYRVVKPGVEGIIECVRASFGSRAP
jgi:DNA-binding transcriptional ArsR family regulator